MGTIENGVGNLNLKNWFTREEEVIEEMDSGKERKRTIRVPRIGRIIAAVPIGILTLIITLGLLFGTWYTVPTGDHAVINSYVTGMREGPDGPAFGFKLPFVEGVTKYEVRTNT